MLSSLDVAHFVEPPGQFPPLSPPSLGDIVPWLPTSHLRGRFSFNRAFKPWALLSTYSSISFLLVGIRRELAGKLVEFFQLSFSGRLLLPPSLSPLSLTTLLRLLQQILLWSGFKNLGG